MTNLWIGMAVVFGLIVGYFLARQSQRQDPIYGGVPAKALHYLLSSIVPTMPVTILVVIFTRESQKFVGALIAASTLFVLLWGTALLFAAVERPARNAALARKAQLGWTEQDARTSGL